ncbi:MAG: hypothetical protein ACI9UK_001508 [Candidatus Krumholzibacteriia bacterium]|jgi:hypothetical protein
MNLRRQNPLLIAALLTVAALICLAVGSRLLIAAGDQAGEWMSGTDGGRFVGTLTLIGGAVVFLLSTIAILAARRYALAVDSDAVDWSGQLELTSVQEWSQDLANLRDDLRRKGDEFERHASFENVDVDQVEIEVPSTWRAKGRYLVDESGTPKDPLADLKDTRDQLLEAAARVDDIVQSINATTSHSTSEAESKGTGPRWWQFFSK